MRIKEEFKRTGYFWLHSAPNKKVPGTLTISDGGIINLEIVELPNDGIDASCNSAPDQKNSETLSISDLETENLQDVGVLDGKINTFSNEDWIERIVGRIEKNSFVTLDSCYRKDGEIDNSISKTSFRVDRVFTGVAYKENEIPCFNTLTFSVEGLVEWLGIFPNKVEFQSEDDIANISYQQQSANILLYREINKCKIQKPYFKLVSEDAYELDELVSFIRKITEFLCFVVNKTVSVESIRATSKDHVRDDGKGNTTPIPVNIYYESFPYSKDEPKINLPKMLFRFKEIQNDAEKKINNWLKSSEKFANAFRLYFLAKVGTQTYLEEKFLTLAQGLEAYHQRIESKRTKFEKRLNKIIEPFKDIFGTNEKRQALIDSIIVTRNYLTHNDLSLKQKAAKGKDLWILCLKMEVLFELHLLKLIGFSEKEIKSIVNNCSDFKYKLLSS